MQTGHCLLYALPVTVLLSPVHPPEVKNGTREESERSDHED